MDPLLESVGHTLWVQTIQLQVLDNCHLWGLIMVGNITAEGLIMIGNITAEGLIMIAKAALRMWDLICSIPLI